MKKKKKFEKSIQKTQEKNLLQYIYIIYKMWNFFDGALELSLLSEIHFTLWKSSTMGNESPHIQPRPGKAMLEINTHTKPSDDSLATLL